jgi:protein O-GlcNAc transferase
VTKKVGFLVGGYKRLQAFLGKKAMSEVQQPLAQIRSAADAVDPVQSEFEKAFALHQQGMLDDAEVIYRSVLQVQPAHADTLHFLGVALAQRQNLSEAATLIRRAIEANPANAAAYSNYGNVLKGLKRNEEALENYDKALAISPDIVDAFNNRGVVLVELDRHEDALLSFEGALALDPDHEEALLNRGESLAALKRYQDALTCFDHVLAANPENARALRGRGIALVNLGRHADALVVYDKIMEIDPGRAEALNNRGSILVALERFNEALEDYDRALKINPRYAEAMVNRGSVLAALGRNEEALAGYDGALAVTPNQQDVLLKRAALLMALKRHKEALDAYIRVLEIDPDEIEALFNRGFALTELMRYEEALASYERVLHFKPNFVEANHNRAMVLSRMRRYEEALTGYNQALALRPEYAEAHYNRGGVLASLNRYEEALASLTRAIALNPEYPEAFNNLGAVLVEVKRYDEALVNYDRALAIRPEYGDALSNRADVFRKMDLYERAAQDYSRLLAIDPDCENAMGNRHYSNVLACNWRDYNERLAQLITAVRDGKRAVLPFSFVVMSSAEAEQLTCARTFVAHKYPSPAKALWTGERYQHDRIRIAYLSADFYHHATAILIAELFEKHDKDCFDVSMWSFGPVVKDEMRERLQKSVEQIHDVWSSSDLEVASMLRDKEIDIAIDLKGFTNGCRPAVFSYRAVPIQVNYLGYPGTMGADYIDYIIGDADVIPYGHDAFYAEKVVRLPDTYQVNDSKRAISVHTPTRAEVGLPESGFVFCCFNNNYKIAPPIFDIWMRLLKQVPDSVLWLFEDNAAVSRNLLSEAERRGIHAERLVFATRMPLPDHLARHRLADLFLDTLPCNAHTTASDALWAGLPLLTCTGHAFAGRVATSLLRAIGLPELITANLADYEALALELATTPAMLNDARAKLLRNKTTHPLFDIDRFRRHIESAYKSMYERHQRGESPESFSVCAVR